MLKSKEMSRVYLLASKNDMKSLIEVLHKLKIYHIIHKNLDQAGFPFKEAEEVAEKINKLNTIFSILGPNEELQSNDPIEIDEIYENIIDKQHELKALNTKLNSMHDQITILTDFSNSPIDKIQTSTDINYTLAKAFVGKIQDPETIQTEIESLTKSYCLWLHENNIILITDINHSEKVESILKNHKYMVADFEFVDTLKSSSFSEARKMLLSVQKSTKEKIQKINNDLTQIKKKHYKALKTMHSNLKSELERLEAPLMCNITDTSFYIEGYVPSNDIVTLSKEIENKIGKKYCCIYENVKRTESAPIALDNPKNVDSFEFFLNLYALPKYSEIDPTFFLMLTFPFIFGAMLGDMGYGILTFIIFFILKRKMPQYKGFFNIFLFSAFWTFVFGIFFGEIFGEEVIFGYALPHVINRLHDINSLLIMAFIIGVLHINFGIILGFINEYKGHGLKHAILGKLSWIILQAGAGLTGYSAMTKAFSIYYGIAIIIISIIMIYKGEGIQGLVEIPGIFSNILSYARIMAIGLASAGLAVVVNDFAKNFFASGIFGIFAGIILLIVGHAINFLLGMLGPFLHSLRLHYVEHFTKFFQGGGEIYHPFGKNEYKA